MTYDAEQLFIRFFAIYAFFFFFFFGEMSVKVFGSFSKNQVVFFHIVEFQKFFVYVGMLDDSLFSDMWVFFFFFFQFFFSFFFLFLLNFQNIKFMIVY